MKMSGLKDSHEAGDSMLKSFTQDGKAEIRELYDVRFLHKN